MDLNDLEKLASVYGVDPAALLMAPDDAPKADQMRRASDIAKQLDAQSAREWLALGQRLAGKPPRE